MSYICLLANEAGAVAAGESRETFPLRVHLDWRKKCFALSRQQMIWAGCGPTFRLGVDFLRAAGLIFRKETAMEKKLEEICALVTAIVKASPWNGDPGPFCLLTAGWEEGRLVARNIRIHHGALLIETREGTEPLFFQAGAYHQKLPPFDRESLRGKGYEELKALARERVALAIRMDEERRAKDPKHDQTIGGPIRLSGLRITKK